MTRKPPNILWICTDQQRYDTIGALNNPQVHTPNIDKLAASGVAFERAFCQSPICTPSRGSFLTGMYPSRVHACINGNERWAEAAPLVTALLADAGYDCALAGKLHLAGTFGRVEPRPQHDGYRLFHWSHDPEDQWESGHAYADWIAEQGRNLGELRKSPHEIPPELHQTSWCSDRAIDFIEADHDGKPWLMSVNIFDPHEPFDPPQSYLDRFDVGALSGPAFRESDLAAQAALADIDFQTPCRRPEEFNAKWIQAAYYAMIELIDDNVGRMLDALERSGQRDNTVVIFMSDHGEMLGDHGLLLKGCRFYEGLARVPLILSWPGQFLDGARRQALVELMDIAPTLLELAGLPAPDRMQGRSLLPLLRDGQAADRHRDFVRCEYYDAINARFNERFSGAYATMLRDERFKLIVYHGHGIGELFDLEADPDEFVNLWDERAMRETKMRLMQQSFDALALATDLGTEPVTVF
ncbi:MAG: sulfatase-like hydrolase/transferase [Chloroflexi bacterium]|nr:sulfatase-like hydrolase/transferase [Chloroflexota bacterium]